MPNPVKWSLKHLFLFVVAVAIVFGVLAYVARIPSRGQWAATVHLSNKRGESPQFHMVVYGVSGTDEDAPRAACIFRCDQPICNHTGFPINNNRLNGHPILPNATDFVLFVGPDKDNLKTIRFPKEFGRHWFAQDQGKIYRYSECCKFWDAFVEPKKNVVAR